MRLFDSHCHLDDPVFQGDLKAVLAAAAAAGVERMLTVGIDADTSRRAVAIASAHPGVWASVGVHPHDARHCRKEVLAELEQLARAPVVRAWGEIGLDFNRMYSPRELQERWFVRQLEAAAALGLPVIFHERDSGGRLIELAAVCPPPAGRAVVHCFSGSAAELEHYLERGWYIGVTGVLTQKERGAALRRLVPEIPAAQLLVETDAPYLVPEPERRRHRRNEPAFVRSVLVKLAEVRREDPEALARTVFENTCRLYGLERP
jgi:TatD DNase family protein